MSLEPKPRARTSQAGRGEREGRVNVILGPALKRRAEKRKEFPGWSPYVRALVSKDLERKS